MDYQYPVSHLAPSSNPPYMEILITQNTTVLHNVHPNGVTTPQWKCCFRIDFNTISPKIILISHLPALVAQSQQAYEVRKISENGRTYSLVNPLSNEDQIIAIAKMIAGEVTDEALDAAKSLIDK